MADFHISQRKINDLIAELRTWEPGELRSTLHELAKQFNLDIFVVDRICRAEGVRPRAVYEIEEPGPPPEDSDPNADTLDLDPKEVEEALLKPESNPNYEDVDTGVWKKHPTGKWELLNKKKN
jgi:hypothetical protein